jgi:hypothetical protein
MDLGPLLEQIRQDGMVCNGDRRKIGTVSRRISRPWRPRGGRRPVMYRRSHTTCRHPTMWSVNWLLTVAASVACMFLMASCSDTRQVGSGEEILLVPKLAAGSAGWCMIQPNDTSATGCRYSRSRPPILAEGWSGVGPPPVTTGLAITTSEVATVSVVGGKYVATRTDPGLPRDLRAAVMEIHGKEVGFLPRFRPINSKGELIAQSIEPGPPLAIQTPTRSVRQSTHPNEDGCRIVAASLPGLVVDGESVAVEIRATQGLLGRAFFSCVETEYNLNNWPIYAAVLLDAAHPGSAPAHSLR